MDVRFLSAGTIISSHERSANADCAGAVRAMVEGANVVEEGKQKVDGCLQRQPTRMQYKQCQPQASDEEQRYPPTSGRPRWNWG